MIKIQKLSLAAALILSFFIFANNAHAFDSVITGSNNAEVDIKNIQTAVDKGGSILLKGIFDFGAKGQIKIKNDIAISGESGPDGDPLTKIKGGFWPFHSPLPSTEGPLPDVGPKIAVKNIHFDGATWTPLHFPYTSGSKISGNKITNVKPYAIPIKWAGGDTLLVSAGVLIGNRFAHREKILPGAATGHQVFENNKVDLKCKDPSKTMSQGAFYIWTWGADIEIKGNKFRNISRNSIETLDNYLDEEGRGSVVIAENNIVTPSVGIPFPSPSTPNGIIVGWFLDMNGASDITKNSKITVIRNFVQTNGESSLGIASLTNGTGILGNRVQIKGGSESRGIVQVGSFAFIVNNKVDGNGAWGIMASTFKEINSKSNTFAWNDLKDFKATAGDVLCMGENNALIGQKCKFVDKGSNNMVLSMY